MKARCALVVALVVSAGLIETVSAQDPAPTPDRPLAFTDQAEAYHLFLEALRRDDQGDAAGAIRALQEAARLDPDAASIPAELAGVYARSNRAEDAIAAGEAALKLDPENVEAHRVLGLVFAELAEQQERGPEARENVRRAVEHLERFQADQLFDLRVSFTLGRLYVVTRAFEKAVTTLERFTERRPGSIESLLLLSQAYAGVDRQADATRVLEEAVRRQPRSFRALTALADLYEQGSRWQRAAEVLGRAVERRPRDLGLKRRWATALLSAGDWPQARDVLDDVVEARPTDGNALYLLSDVERRLTHFDEAEAAARRLIALDPDGIRGVYSLAQVFLRRREYAALIDTVEPAIVRARANGRSGREIALLLVQTGISHQAQQDSDEAVRAFEEAHTASPEDPALDAYLGQAYLDADRADAALEFVTAARKEHPGDLRLAGLEARALAASGQPDRGIAVMRAAVAEHDDDPITHIALANLFVDTGRVDEAVLALESADQKFPTATSIQFQLGAIFEQQQQYADAERALRTVLSRDPLHHQALNYLGYMLADRGERLEESVELITRALESDPHNGSYLDSLGWAYFKLNRLDLAETYLRQASAQLTRNSVVQDHFGDLLSRQERFAEAIEAWERALAGDAESIEPVAIEQKIRDAREKLGR